MKRQEILDTLERHSDEIRAFGVENLTLIGSYARDAADADSDIDFLVEFADGRGMFDDYAGLLSFLEELLGKDVDLGEPDLIRDELRSSILGGEKVEAQI